MLSTIKQAFCQYDPAPKITQDRSVVIMTTQFKIWMVRGGIWVVIKFVEQFIIFRQKRKL